MKSWDFWKTYAYISYAIILIMAFNVVGDKAIKSKCYDYCDKIVEVDWDDYDLNYPYDASDEAKEEYEDRYLGEYYACSHNCRENNLVEVSYFNPLNFRYWTK